MLRDQENPRSRYTAALTYIRGYRSVWVVVVVCVLMLTSCRASGNAGASQTVASPSQTGTRNAIAPGMLGACQQCIVNRPVASMGCGKASPIAVGSSADETISSGGLARSYRLHVPSGYQTNKRQALVLDFHGHGGRGDGQEGYTGFSALADQNDFIVVYPQGTIGPDGMTGWASGGSRDPTVDDVLFVSDLLNHLQATLCVDPQRIYATGISNGGGMTGLLACRLAGRIAAFAPVAGAFYPISGACHPGRAVAILEFHGTSDPLVRYTGAASVSLPPIPQWLQDWATRDGCTSGPTTFFSQAEVAGEQWAGCQAGASVVHYRIDGGGHTWPGAAFDIPILGRTTHTINATMLMWQFFQAHPLPGA